MCSQSVYILGQLRKLQGLFDPYYKYYYNEIASITCEDVRLIYSMSEDVLLSLEVREFSVNTQYIQRLCRFMAHSYERTDFNLLALTLLLDQLTQRNSYHPHASGTQVNLTMQFGFINMDSYCRNDTFGR